MSALDSYELVAVGETAQHPDLTDSERALLQHMVRGSWWTQG